MHCLVGELAGGSAVDGAGMLLDKCSGPAGAPVLLPQPGHSSGEMWAGRVALQYLAAQTREEWQLTWESLEKLCQLQTSIDVAVT